MSTVHYSNAGWERMGAARYLSSLGMSNSEQLGLATRFDKRAGPSRSNRFYEWRNFYADTGAAGSGGFDPSGGKGGFEPSGGKGGKEKGGKEKGGKSKGGKDKGGKDHGGKDKGGKDKGGKDGKDKRGKGKRGFEPSP